MVNKELMKKRFARGLSTYRNYAVVQKKMAAKLVSFVQEKWGISHRVILEIGCGSGLLTEKMVKTYIFDTIYSNDIVPECEELITSLSPSIRFTPGDAEEELQIPADINLVISNATFQWLNDLPSFIEKLLPNMKDQSLLAFSTFGEHHFHEFASLGFPSLRYFEFDTIKKILTPHFDIVYCKEEQEILYFKTPREVLKHLKLTGVNSIQQEQWTKGRIGTFEAAYKKDFMTRKGVRLTYNPYYFIARKKS